MACCRIFVDVSSSSTVISKRTK
uniref:Uncharacterized protein n=1 Tax=Anguilla anguilla TaxID=7936 RepID=A0A0E9PPL3_ANGAN